MTRNNLQLAVLFTALFAVAGAVNLQAPLFSLYAAQAGMGKVAVTVIFGAYVAGILPLLALAGGISDRLGRKPVLIASLACSIAATVAVMVSPTIAWLLVARVLQGFGIALSIPAVTAWVAERWDPARGASVAAASTTLGFGSGAMATSLVTDGVSLVPPSYPACALVLLVTLLGVLALPAPQPLGQTKWIRLPAFPSGSALASMALGIGWGVAGLVVSLLPMMLRSLGVLAWSGPALVLMLIGGALAQSHARRLRPARSLKLGAVIQLAAALVLVAGAYTNSAVTLCLGAVAGGIASHGYTLTGGLNRITQRATERERSRAVSGYFVMAYLGFAGLPLLAGQVPSTLHSLLLTAAIVLLGAIIILASAARSCADAVEAG